MASIIKFGKWKKVKAGHYEFYNKGLLVATVHNRDGFWEINYKDIRENFYYGGVSKTLYRAQIGVMDHLTLKRED